MTTRRLAAILAADVVSYSAMMERDEEGTLAKIKALQRDVMEPKVTEHHGRIVKTTGDGFLIEFSSPVEAVRCATAVQEALNSGSLPLRIGLNLGDIIIEDDGDVYGDGVNIAARLEGIADPGGIALSGTVYDQVRKVLPLPYEDLGLRSLKNIEEPVRVFAIGGASREERSSQREEPRPLPLADKPSIAVLPFHNIGGDPEQVYFSDGMTEDVITELGRFREFIIFARNSSFAFRPPAADPREIGRALNANYVVQGSVRRAGDRVRITAQLVDASQGAELWAERYDRAIADVFAVQEEIARSIVATVARRVVEESEIAARRRLPQDMRAYDLVLRALRLSDTFTPEAQAQVEALYEQARAIDPGFARVYTGLAYQHLNRVLDVIAPISREIDEHRREALRLAEQALVLDPNDPRAHATLAHICIFVRNFDRAERHFYLARSMNPNDALHHVFWGYYARGLRGAPEEGLAAIDVAVRLNPRHPRWYDSLRGRLLVLLGRYEPAAALLDQQVFISPARDLRDQGWRAAALALAGRADEGRAVAERLLAAIQTHWRGPPDAGSADYIEWIAASSFLDRPEHEEKLRTGLKLLGLPA